MSTIPSIRHGLVIDHNHLSFKQCISFTIKNNSKEDVNVLPQLLQQQQQQQQSTGSDWGREDEDRNKLIHTYNSHLTKLNITLCWFIIISTKIKYEGYKMSKSNDQSKKVWGEEWEKALL